MKNKLKMCLLLLLVGSLLFSVPSFALQKVVVNEVTHSVFYAPQYVAMALGYFEKQGIEIDLVNGGGSDKSMTALLAAHADIGLMGPETAVYVYNQGKEDHAVIIGQLTNCDGSFLVGKTPHEHFAIEDLENQTIIGGRKGGMPVMTFLYVLNKHGLKNNENVFVRTDIQFNLMAGAFEGSEAQFVTLFEPTASLCQKEKKGHILLSIGKESGDIPFTAYMVKKSSLEKNRALYQKYMYAVHQAQTYILEHSEKEIATLIAPYFPDADVELLAQVCVNYKKIGAWKETPFLEKEDYERLLDVIDFAGELEQRPAYETVVDNSLLTFLPK